MLDYHHNMKKPSRELRMNMTHAEQALWARLRRKQLHEIQFYRQKPIGPYIVDFYGPAAGLVIEIDGSQHYEPEYLPKDAERDQYLAENGLKVLRFSNVQVLNETDSVVVEIAGMIQDRLGNPPRPPLPKGGEFDLIMISALEHYSYCPRQCALIHVEQVWDENIYTMRGRHVHEHVDEVSSHGQGGVRFERALPIWSRRLNLVGKADLVEFHGDTPFPVEYKSGRRRKGHHESLQLCAQAVCLEEMFGIPVTKGALYWHASRERIEIGTTDAMRSQLEEVAAAVRRAMQSETLPEPSNDARCRDCSLKESCLPHVVGEKERRSKVANDVFELNV